METPYGARGERASLLLLDPASDKLHDPHQNHNFWAIKHSLYYNVGPPVISYLVYKPHEYYSYKYHKA